MVCGTPLQPPEWWVGRGEPPEGSDREGPAPHLGYGIALGSGASGVRYGTRIRGTRLDALRGDPMRDARNTMPRAETRSAISQAHAGRQRRGDRAIREIPRGIGHECDHDRAHIIDGRDGVP